MAEPQIHRALCPRVAVLSSPDVDDLVHANDLDDLASLLRPFENSVERRECLLTPASTVLLVHFIELSSTSMRFDGLQYRCALRSWRQGCARRSPCNSLRSNRSAHQAMDGETLIDPSNYSMLLVPMLALMREDGVERSNAASLRGREMLIGSGSRVSEVLRGIGIG